MTKLRTGQRGNSGSIYVKGKGFLSFPKRQNGPKSPLSLIFNRDREHISCGVKRPGSEAGHSPAPSAEVKNDWSNTTITPYDCSACTGKENTLSSYIYFSAVFHV